ncbi:hypothetical protein OCJ37_07975 [Xanthomonas sp. AM6]|uniref:hypothetical protein n=1 Tax=Xanthomonas sp. AM6 TaxID=2982531 RepID=UPI0021D8CC96|nr:hypothetical protein [Xanthomonas sp. AM6]UYB53866.1 hypothetical protein OCJ37_07975 [Xanthomonas sp. AM6]
MTKPLITVLACFGSVSLLSFVGYLLPWGQMAFWGAQMIGSLLGATAGGQA